MVLTRGEESVDKQLLGTPSDLPQALSLKYTNVPAREILQGLTGEQVQSLVEDVRRTVRFTQRQQLASPMHEVLEGVTVDIRLRQCQPIARGGGLDRVAAQLFAKPDDTALEVLAGRGGRRLPPQGVGQPVDGDVLTHADGERLQDHPVLWRHTRLKAADPQWPKHCDPGQMRSPHTLNVEVSRGFVNTGHPTGAVVVVGRP